jgi:hypothetical protein
MASEVFVQDLLWFIRLPLVNAIVIEVIKFWGIQGAGSEWYCEISSCTQVVNGMFERPDWEAAIAIPVAVVPGGSGNGLAKSICYYSGWVLCDVDWYFLNDISIHEL